MRNAVDSVKSIADRTFDTPLGKRIVDAFNDKDRLIAEAKYGYVSLTDFILRQIEKDFYLLSSGQVDKVEWHFYLSQLTGKGGPSRELLHELLYSGFDVIFH